MSIRRRLTKAPCHTLLYPSQRSNPRSSFPRIVISGTHFPPIVALTTWMFIFGSILVIVPSIVPLLFVSMAVGLFICFLIYRRTIPMGFIRGSYFTAATLPATLSQAEMLLQSRPYLMEKIFVDLLYYDHIVSTMLEMYVNEKPEGEIVPYAEIATILNKNLRSQGRKFDSELYLKEIYLRVFQVLRAAKSNTLADIEDLVDALRIIRCEWPEASSDTQFRAVYKVIIGLYTFFRPERVREKFSGSSPKSWRTLIGFDGEDEADDFPWSFVKESLKKVQFKRPGLIGYARGVIRSARGESQKSRRLQLFINSPGEKIPWE